LGEGDVADTLQKISSQQETLIKTRKRFSSFSEKVSNIPNICPADQTLFSFPSLKISWMLSENKNIRHYGIFRQ